MKTAKVLLMDDDAPYLKLLCRMVGALGYDCAGCARGEEALALCAEAKEHGAPFRAAMLDMIIDTGMGGLETAERLRELYPDILLILSSGYSGEVSWAEIQKHGFNANLPKPFKLAELGAVLAENCGSRTPGAPVGGVVS